MNPLRLTWRQHPVQLSSFQGGNFIFVLGKAHMRYTLFSGRFPSVAFETILIFVTNPRTKHLHLMPEINLGEWKRSYRDVSDVWESDVQPARSKSHTVVQFCQYSMICTVTLLSSADDDRESGHRGKEAGENDAGDESRSTQRDERTGVGKCLIHR